MDVQRVKSAIDIGAHIDLQVCRANGRRLLDLDRGTILRRFRTSGVVLFRSFEIDLAVFKLFTDGLARDFMSYVGGASIRDSVKGDQTVMSVSEAKSTIAIPLHGEMYYAADRPKVIWFYCARPADQDGQTTIADGRWMYRRLSPAARTLFEKSRIRYVMVHTRDRWAQIFQSSELQAVEAYCKRADWSMRIIDDGGAIITEHLSRAIWRNSDGALVYVNNLATMVRWERLALKVRRVRLEDGSPLPNTIVDEISALDEEASVPIEWNVGDVLMIDNTRMMHGRRAFMDLKREIYVRMAKEVLN